MDAQFDLTKLDTFETMADIGEFYKNESFEIREEVFQYLASWYMFSVYSCIEGVMLTQRKDVKRFIKTGYALKDLYKELQNKLPKDAGTLSDLYQTDLEVALPHSGHFSSYSSFNFLNEAIPLNLHEINLIKPLNRPLISYEIKYRANLILGKGFVTKALVKLIDGLRITNPILFQRGLFPPSLEALNADIRNNF